MRIGFGAVIIILASSLVTFLIFGKGIDDSPKSAFFYWLKSTLFLATLLFVWFGYNDSAAFGFVGALASIVLAGLFTFGRAYLLAML